MDCCAAHPCSVATHVPMHSARCEVVCNLGTPTIVDVSEFVPLAELKTPPPGFRISESLGVAIPASMHSSSHSALRQREINRMEASDASTDESGSYVPGTAAESSDGCVSDGCVSDDCMSDTERRVKRKEREHEARAQYCKENDCSFFFTQQEEDFADSDLESDCAPNSPKKRIVLAAETPPRNSVHCNDPSSFGPSHHLVVPESPLSQ